MTVMDERRHGDDRPLRHDPMVRLAWRPNYTKPFRWLPRHGDPYCIGEWASQFLIKLVAYLPLYTAIIVTLTLLAVVFGVPFVAGK